LLVRAPDLLHAGRSTYRITEPLVTFYEAVMRPSWTALEQRQAAEVWRHAAHRYTSAVLGPTLQGLVREWLLRFASTQLLGGPVAVVGSGTVADPDQRQNLQLDVVALGELPRGGGPRPVLVIGEVTWGEVAGEAHLRRIERALALLQRRPGLATGATKLLLSSAAGFCDALRGEAKRPRSNDVLLVDLDQLYHP
jgi:hypothetical protein